MLVFLWSLLGWLSCLWSLYQSSVGLLVVIVRLVVLFVVTLLVLFLQSLDRPVGIAVC